MLKVTAFLVLSVVHSPISNGLDLNRNEWEEFRIFRELLNEEPDCSQFGVGCIKCPEPVVVGCQVCSNGYVLEFDIINNYNICISNDSTAAPTTKPSPYPTPKPSPAPHSSAPSDPPTVRPTNKPIVTPQPTSMPTNPECKRYRKAWHLLTDEERMLFIDGWFLLHDADIITEMSDLHNHSFHGNAFHNARGNSAFLPWHRYFLWEVETQFRGLGPEWECFGLPYWDWGHDAFDESTSIIYSSGLSGAGESGESGESVDCVIDDYFDSDSYSIHGGCLERSNNTANDLFSGDYFANSVSLTIYIVNIPEYVYYRQLFEALHNTPHCAINGNMCSGNAPSDPLFYLHHAYVDFLWAVWQDCHDYDLFDKGKLDSDVYPEIYWHWDVDNVELDDLMDFDMISDETWSVVNDYNPTMRDMHSIEDWNVQYDIGSFWDESGVEDSLYCGDVMNSEWFGDDASRRRRTMENDETETETQRERRGSAENGGNEYLSQQRERLKRRNDLTDFEKREEMSKISCQYSKANAISNGWIEESCQIPKDFENCQDIELGLNEDEKRYYKISLDDLLNKSGVRDSNCLKEIRIQMYPWLDVVGGLLDLCDGLYDPKC